MKFEISPSHVAVLVPDVRKAASFLEKFGFELGPEDEFPNEGEREIYIEMNKRNPLLLMEPLGEGSYKRALAKRGPGLHHLAIDVLDLEKYIENISGSGWLLHPRSVATIKRSKTAYLARPGFPGLIEVQEKEKLGSGPLFVSEILLAVDAKLVHLLDSIGLQGIVKPSSGETRFVVGGKPVRMQDLL